MNLVQFLKSVDETAATMTKDDLTEFLHDIARTLQENKREDFLKRLRGEDGKKEISQEIPEEGEDFEQRKNLLKSQLERIENWELGLEASLNQEYDDWYDSEDEEFLYSDPEGVVPVIEEACRFVHHCIDFERYEVAYEIADILIGLDIRVGRDYQDYTDEPMNIRDLEHYNLGNVDYKALVVDGAHAAYCASVFSERADELYRVIENSGRRDITLEMLMQNGSELPDMDAFLPLWIEYLGRITTDNAERLLQEALEMTGSGEQLLANARKYCVEHPELYEQYLQSNQEKEGAVSLLAVGKEALDAIGKKYLVRSRIALLTSWTALELGRREEAEACWLEAFRSDTRVVNYFRLLMECKDFSKVKEKVNRICRQTRPKADVKGYFFSATNKKQNQVSPKTAYLLAFLEGVFSYVRENAMNVKGSLGWSSSFMKCGLAAFLLLLTEGTDLQQGNREMIRQLAMAADFEKSEYEKGTLRVIGQSNEEWFRECWNCWKRTVSLSSEEKEALFQWVEELITKRVKGIMDGNHRKYYGECAAYIAALGEARESAGRQNGKQETMVKYMELYSRRSAFREEMWGYGMRDSRKKK